MRSGNRKNLDMRDVSIETGVLHNAHGSCLIKMGKTHVMCSATIDDYVPHFLKGKGEGWVTAEYSMLPTSTNQRIKREISTGKPSGRTQEIQRLIGRALRAVVDLRVLGERQVIIDCDVINADGGTRTASITGGYVALYLALNDAVARRAIRSNPVFTQVAAISCGVLNNDVLVDLDYIEDSSAEVDANFVMRPNGEIVEVQGCGERKTFTAEQMNFMLEAANKKISELFAIQNAAILNITAKNLFTVR